jgi:hypothetical protein
MNRMAGFLAEASLYKTSGHYHGAVGWPDLAHGSVVPAQPLPTCGTGNYVNCQPGILPNCPTNCVQRCMTPAGIGQECCPAEKCGPAGDCCKQVCCEVKVM